MTEFNKDAPEGAGHGGKFSHAPVLLKEAIEFLAIRRGGTYIDATLGLGGHAFEIAKRLGRQGHLIGVDKDTNALEIARRRLSEPPVELKHDWPEIKFAHASFAEVGKLVSPASADGLLADLGVSSMQLENAARGFSFQAEGPLDMRMDPTGEVTAEQVVNHMREEELANVIYEFGDERRSRRIARAIVRARPIRSTAHLAKVISASAPTMNLPVPRKSGARQGAQRKGSGIHPATKTFQAIRIFVNRELDDVRALITGKTAGALTVLKNEGRVAIISFHSLEDRIVKDALREGAQGGWWRVVTKKPVTAGEEEIDRNPRARSAKMRVAEKV